MSFVNFTRYVDAAVREELKALRLVAMQNRMNQTTAAQDGVCASVGTACCTYIPANEMRMDRS